ncbi:MAG: TraR/DksA C4-type zinc finger protein [Oligoflexia bacterium]|nr:TraR/DksA C4-type zinc finger protein [Oligoflexia bacterium]
MPVARKLDASQYGLSPDEIKQRYAEFARLLLTRSNELLPLDQSARANLDEQIQTSPGDEADASVIDTNADYFLKLANSHQRELIEIRDALDRMHRGVYGVCENCGEGIAIARLQRLPHARFCIDCQSTRERLRSVAFPHEKPTL